MRTTPVHSGYSIINGTGTGSNGGRIDVWIEYKQESQSIENNNTRVIAYLYAALKSGESSSTWGSNGCYSTFSVNGVSGANLKNNGPYDFRISTPILMGSFDGNVAHNADGTKTVWMAGTFSTPSSYISGGNVSGSVTLTTIPRATTPGVSDMTMGTQTTISLSSRASGSFTHTLKYKFGSATGTLATKTAATSFNWTPALTLANQVPNAASGTVSIICETYSGATLIGTKTVNKTLSVPTSVVPTVSALDVTRASDNAVVVSWDKFVKGYSYASLEATSGGVYGSTIVSYNYQVLFGATVKQSTTVSSNAWNSGILTEAGTYTFKVTVTDSRGRTASLTTTEYTVLDYSIPSIAATDVFRCISDGTIDLSDGTYISAKGTFNYSSVDGSNSLTKKIEYRQSGASSWTLGQDNPTDDTAYIFSGASASYTYEVKFTADDDLTGAVTLTVLVKPGAVYMHYKPGGKGLGIGGATTADELQVHWPAKFKGDVEVEGILGVGGNEVWNAGNFDPDDYLPLDGGTLTNNLIIDSGDGSYREFVIRRGNNDARFVQNGTTDAQITHLTNGVGDGLLKVGAGGPFYGDGVTDYRLWYEGEHHSIATLWSGSWASGNITVPNSTKYTVFRILTSYSSSPLIGIRSPDGSTIMGIGALPTQHILTLRLNVSGTTWTLNSSAGMLHNSGGNHNAAVSLTVTHITGLL